MAFAGLESFPKISGFTLGTITLSQLTGRGSFLNFSFSFSSLSVCSQRLLAMLASFRRQVHQYTLSHQVTALFLPVNHVWLVLLLASALSISKSSLSLLSDSDIALLASSFALVILASFQRQVRQCTLSHDLATALSSSKPS